MAVAGAGMMGRNHLRILSSMRGVELTGVIDPHMDASHPNVSNVRVPVVETLDDLPPTDAIVVATPTASHLAVATAALTAGMHVLVEKPIAGTWQEAEELVACAASQGLVLAGGHVAAAPQSRFRSLRSICREPRLMSFERTVALHSSHPDTVVMDLMVHDLDLALWLTGEYPRSIHAHGARVFSDSWDVAAAVLAFPCGAIASL